MPVLFIGLHSYSNFWRISALFRAAVAGQVRSWSSPAVNFDNLYAFIPKVIEVCVPPKGAEGGI